MMQEALVKKIKALTSRIDKSSQDINRRFIEGDKDLPGLLASLDAETAEIQKVYEALKKTHSSRRGIVEASRANNAMEEVMGDIIALATRMDFTRSAIKATLQKSESCDEPPKKKEDEEDLANVTSGDILKDLGIEEEVKEEKEDDEPPTTSAKKTTAEEEPKEEEEEPPAEEPEVEEEPPAEEPEPEEEPEKETVSVRRVANRTTKRQVVAKVGGSRDPLEGLITFGVPSGRK